MSEKLTRKLDIISECCDDIKSSLLNNLSMGSIGELNAMIGTIELVVGHIRNINKEEDEDDLT